MAELRGVSFVAGGHLYAVPFRWVTELVDEPALASAPEGGDAAGLARVRDRWVPVVAVARGLPIPAAAPGRVMIVLGGRTARLGILADELRGLVEWTGPGDRTGTGPEPSPGPVTSSAEGIVTWIDPVELVDGREELFSEGGDVMERATTATPAAHVVELQLGEDAFGINVTRVYEVIRYPAVRALPQMPPFLEGVAELRGSVLPVVDLRKRFGIEPGPPAPETRVIVIDLSGERVGLVVDRVVGVARLAVDQIRPAPKFFKGLAARYLEGVVNREDRNVIVLNTDEILTSKEKIQLRGAGRTTGAAPKEPPAPE